MTRAARVYIALIVALGAAALASGLAAWECRDPIRFGIFLAVSLLTAGMKVRLPGISSTLSVCFLFTLAGIVSLSLPETLAAGCSAVVLQCIWHSAKKLKTVQLLFNCASISLAITVSYRVYHACALAALPFEYSVLLLVLAGSYFLTQTFPVATVIALTEGKPVLKTWRESYFWSWPYYLLGAAVAGLFGIAQRHLGWQTTMLILPVPFLVYRSYTRHVDRLNNERRHAEEMAALNLRIVESLARAIEAKDQTTHHHLKRVEVYAVGVGRALGLSDPELQALRAGALLHDIGKLAVPDYILSKPGRLSREEFEKVKLHSTVGAQIVESARFPYEVAPIVRCHHERWDGSGYPLGLKGEEIPIGARILAAVDCLDGLASDRQYRRALPLPEAMRTVAGGAGAAFDPRVVAVLEQRCVELEGLARAEIARLPEPVLEPAAANLSAPGAGLEVLRDTGPSSPPGGAVPVDIACLLDDLSDAKRALRRKFAAAAGALGRRLPSDALALYMRQGDVLVPEYVAGSSAHLLSAAPLPVGQGVSGWVAENNRPIVNGNPEVEPNYRAGTGAGGHLASALCVPLTWQQGNVGVLAVYRAARNAFGSADLELASSVASRLAPILLATGIGPDRRASSREELLGSALEPATEELLSVQ
jgi:putative nucleotidyltransferase with HDIG domain